MTSMTADKHATLMSLPLHTSEKAREGQQAKFTHALLPKDRAKWPRATYSRPIPNSYWATPLLVACEYPWDPNCPKQSKLDDLLRSGVRTFIDLTEVDELRPYSHVLDEHATSLGIDPRAIEYHRFPICDRSLPVSADFMDQVFGVLRDNEARGRVSAVHCRGGIGRTGTVVGCWLVESLHAKDGEEALGMIAQEWKSVAKCRLYPASPETGAQCEFVRRFESHCLRSVVSRTDGPLKARNMFSTLAGALQLCIRWCRFRPHHELRVVPPSKDQ